MLSAGQGSTIVRSCCSNKQWFVTATAHLTDSLSSSHSDLVPRYCCTCQLLLANAQGYVIPRTSAYRHCLLWLFFELTHSLSPHRLLCHSLFPPTTHTRHHHQHQNKKINKKIQLSSVVMDLETLWRAMHTCIPKYPSSAGTDFNASWGVIKYFYKRRRRRRRRRRRKNKQTKNPNHCMRPFRPSGVFGLDLLSFKLSEQLAMK